MVAGVHRFVSHRAANASGFEEHVLGDDDDDDDDDGAGENRAIYSSTVLFRFDNGASRTVSQITGPMVETAWREAVGRGRTTRFKILSPLSHALAIGI